MEEMTSSRLVPRFLPRGQAALALFALSVLGGLVEIFFSHYGRVEAAGVALAVLALPLVLAGVVLPWAGLWALAARILRQKIRFWAHVSIPLLAGLAHSAAGLVIGLACFALDMDRVLPLLSVLAAWAIGVWAIGAHLHWVARRSRRWIWTGAFLAVTGLFAFFGGIAFLFIETFGVRPEHHVSLLPHFLRAAPARTSAEHLQPLARLQKSVDEKAGELAGDLR